MLKLEDMSSHEVTRMEVKAREIRSLLNLADKLGIRRIDASELPAIATGICIAKYGMGWRLKREDYRFYLIKRL